VTRHPTSAWIVPQLREAFPYDPAPKYLIFDRGANFNQEVIDKVKDFGTQPKRTSFRSSWQNGVAERWVPVAAIATITTTDRTLPWTKERLPVVKQKRIPMQAARS